MLERSRELLAIDLTKADLWKGVFGVGLDPARARPE
jgi:hypothetical protein